MAVQSLFLMDGFGVYGPRKICADAKLSSGVFATGMQIQS
jgi:hypothetical protein